MTQHADSKSDSGTLTSTVNVAHELQARGDGTVLSTDAFDAMAVGLRKMVGSRLPVELHRGETFTDGPVIRGVNVGGAHGSRCISVDVEFDQKTDVRILSLIGGKSGLGVGALEPDLAKDARNLFRNASGDASAR
jgi:hypothetical protein